jgi:mannose-6-phosphate isomerase-like protein (cupin superfamily)
MERRKFVQSTLTLLAATSMASPILAQKNTPPKKGFKVKALDTRYKDKIVYGNIPIDFKLLSSDTEDRLSVFISSNNQKGFGPPLHLHHTFDEFFCVLDGTFVFELDSEIIKMDKGDSIFIPRNVQHRFNYDGETSGTLLVGITPAKDMEKYFTDMGKLLTGNGMPDMVAMQALYKRYNSVILGPPMK